MRKLTKYFTAIAVYTFAVCILYQRFLPHTLSVNGKAEYSDSANNPDSDDYYTLAANVAAGNGFSADGKTPSVLRPPMFPLMLGVWFKLSETSYDSAYYYQAFVYSLTCAAAFLLFMEIFGALRFSLLLTAWLAILPPHLARITHSLLEPTMALFTTLSILLSVRALRSNKLATAALAGASWGVLTLSKFPSWIGPVLLAAGSFIPGTVRLSRKQAGALMLMFAVTLTPWAIRNYRHFHKLILVNAQGACMLELFTANTYKLSPHSEDPKFGEARTLIKEMNAQGLSDSQKFDKLLPFVWKDVPYFLFERPLVATLYFTFPDFYGNWYTSPLSPSQRYWKSVAYAWWLALVLPLYLVLFYRCFQLVRGKLRAPLGFLVVFYLVYWAQYAMIWCDPRYSVPVYVILLCLLPLNLNVKKFDMEPATAVNIR
ncbi:MAG: glycosyltransferase family 39 protein [Elusimicrobia bacterium]|nr:glycosyltransferase family 39 protein [Elusimicrobiota bacterium]